MTFDIKTYQPVSWLKLRLERTKKCISSFVLMSRFSFGYLRETGRLLTTDMSFLRWKIFLCYYARTINYGPQTCLHTKLPAHCAHSVTLILLTRTRESMDFFTFMLQVYIRKIRMSWKKHLLSGFQNSLIQTWLKNIINEQVLVQKIRFLRITVLEPWWQMVFSTDSDLSYIYLQHKSEKVHGLFGLVWKNQGRTV